MERDTCFTIRYSLFNHVTLLEINVNYAEIYLLCKVGRTSLLLTKKEVLHVWVSLVLQNLEEGKAGQCLAKHKRFV